MSLRNYLFASLFSSVLVLGACTDDPEMPDDGLQGASEEPGGDLVPTPDPTPGLDPSPDPTPDPTPDPQPNPVDDTQPATFANADTAHLMRAVGAAGGIDAAMAQLMASIYAGAEVDPTGCPAITREGSVTHVSGGCTMTDGTVLSGSISLDNVQALFGDAPYDATRPSILVFADWRGDDGEASGWDGQLRLEPDGRRIASMKTLQNGLHAEISMTLTCGADPSALCTAADGSSIRIEGLGTASVSGAWAFANPPSGSIRLGGADVLTVDVAGSTRNCMSYEINGTPKTPICQ